MRPPPGNGAIESATFARTAERQAPIGVALPELEPPARAVFRGRRMRSRAAPGVLSYNARPSRSLSLMAMMTSAGFQRCRTASPTSRYRDGDAPIQPYC